MRPSFFETWISNMSTPRKIRCTVETVTDHGDRVYTVALKPERAVPAFLPGQFLHLTLDEYDPSGFWPESRVFSIASSPADRSALTLIYSVKGKYTARMEAELCVGKSVWVKLPYGEFVVDGATDAILIAGGTGITAFQAFIEGLPPNHPHKVVLLYGARRPGLLLGREKIEAKVQGISNFRAYYFCEVPVVTAPALSLPKDVSSVLGGEDAADTAATTGGIIPGRIHLNILKDCPLSASAVYYLAGPPPMVAALTNELAQRGVSGHNVRVDAWE
jgi:NAD(P)H-flavin reductase